MGKRDELLREFEHLTIPENGSAPTPQPPPPPQDTLGRIIQAATPWIRWYVLAWLLTTLTVLVLFVLSAFLHGGSWSGANAWLRHASMSPWHAAWWSAGFATLLFAFRLTFRTPPRFRRHSTRR